MLAANTAGLARGNAAAANGVLALSKQLNVTFARQSDEQLHFDRCVLSRRRKHTRSSSSANSEADNSHDDVDSHDGLESANVCPALPSPSEVRSFREIPGPRGLPFIGTLWDYLKKDGLKFNKMFEVMQQRSEAYGPIYREQIGHLKSVVISDPEEYAKVIHVDGKYPNRIEMEPIAYYRRSRGLTLGTVNGQGKEWYRHRTILSQKTLRPFEVLKHVGPMDKVASDFVQHIHNRRTDQGVVPTLEHEIFKWALESIGTMLFEDRIGCFDDPPPKQAHDFIENLVGFFKYMQPLMYNVPVYKVLPTKTWKIYEGYADRVLQIGQTFVDKKVAALEKQAKHGLIAGEKEERSEFLTYLLSQTNLTPEEANSNCVDLMMGAVETTSNGLLWTLFCLSKSPSAQTSLYRETTNLLPDQEEITPEKVQKMQYVKACLRETFRLYPITFATSRRIAKDIEVCGFHIPAGTHCQANLYGMGRNADLFQDPLRFIPERWLRNHYDGPVKALTNLPFGHGPRMCIGRRLAEQELYIVLSKIIQNFKLEYDGDEDVQPVLNTVMTPDRPLRLVFIPRTRNDEGPRDDSAEQPASRKS